MIPHKLNKMLLVRYISEADNKYIKSIQSAFSNLDKNIDFKTVLPVEPTPFIKDNNYVTKTNQMRLLGKEKGYISRSRQSFEDIDTIGAIGCGIAHMRLWKETIEKQTNMLVLERRVYISENINKDLINMVNSLEKNDMHFLSISRMAPNIFSFKPCDFISLKNTVPLTNLYYLIGIQAYLVTPYGAKILVNNFLPIDKHTDSYILYIASTLPKHNFCASKSNFGLSVNRLKKSSISHGGNYFQSLPSIVIIYFIIIIVIFIIILNIIFINMFLN